MRDGELSPDRPEALMRHLERSLDANPAFTWASFGDRDGTFIAAYRWPVDDTLVARRTLRQQLPARDRPAGVTPPPARFRDWQREPDGSWVAIADDEERAYDPRVRPWYRAVAELGAGEGRWIDPYVFLSRMQLGVAFSLPTHDASGELLGVWAAEFEAGPISVALEAYRDGRFAEAAAGFADADARLEGDPASALLAERCQAYSERPPADWEGVHDVATK